MDAADFTRRKRRLKRLIQMLCYSPSCAILSSSKKPTTSSCSSSPLCTKTVPLHHPLVTAYFLSELEAGVLASAHDLDKIVPELSLEKVVGDEELSLLSSEELTAPPGRPLKRCRRSVDLCNPRPGYTLPLQPQVPQRGLLRIRSPRGQRSDSLRSPANPLGPP